MTTEHEKEIESFGANNDFWIFGYGYVNHCGEEQTEKITPPPFPLPFLCIRFHLSHTYTLLYVYVLGAYVFACMLHVYMCSLCFFMCVSHGLTRLVLCFFV